MEYILLFMELLPNKYVWESLKYDRMNIYQIDNNLMA